MLDVRIDYEQFPVVMAEGIDGVGKSTLGSLLAPHDYRILHASYRPAEDSLFDYYKMRLALQRADGRVFFDRGFLSEHVYGPVFRKRSRLTDAQLRILAEQLAVVGGVVVYITAPFEGISRWLAANANDNHEQVLERLPMLSARYDEVLSLVADHVEVAQVKTRSFRVDDTGFAALRAG